MSYRYELGIPTCTSRSAHTPAEGRGAFCASLSMSLCYALAPCTSLSTRKDGESCCDPLKAGGSFTGCVDTDGALAASTCGPKETNSSALIKHCLLAAELGWKCTERGSFIKKTGPLQAHLVLVVIGNPTPVVPARYAYAAGRSSSSVPFLGVRTEAGPATSRSIHPNLNPHTHVHTHTFLWNTSVQHISMLDVAALLAGLPGPLGSLASAVLLEPLPHVDALLLLAALVLVALAFGQLHAFSRPPAVPPKRLPKRPTLHVLFKPDQVGEDIGSSSSPKGRGAAGRARGAQQQRGGTDSAAHTDVLLDGWSRSQSWSQSRSWSRGDCS